MNLQDFTKLCIGRSVKKILVGATGMDIVLDNGLTLELYDSASFVDEEVRIKSGRKRITDEEIMILAHDLYKAKILDAWIPLPRKQKIASYLIVFDVITKNGDKKRVVIPAQFWWCITMNDE